MAKNRSKLEVINRERVPSSGVMIVPNRLEFTDMLHLEKELAGRRIVYLVERSMQYDPLLQAHLEKEDVLALEFSADTTQREVFKKQVHSGVASDEVLVFIPGPVRFRSGQITPCLPGVLRFLIEAGAPVLPLFVDHPVDTRLSIESVTETDLSWCFPSGRFWSGKQSRSPITRRICSSPPRKHSTAAASSA
ncbi:MAG: hypothetical protein R3F31_21340 [Verrucomicrobiales bacterium]